MSTFIRPSNFLSIFHGALRLTGLSVSWGCYKSILPVAVLSYCICVISSFHILIILSKPWNDRKVFEYYKSQKKEVLSNKKYFSAVVWTCDCLQGMFMINVTLQGCSTLSFSLLSAAELQDGIKIIVIIMIITLKIIIRLFTWNM